MWERRADAGSLAQLSQGVGWEVGHIGDYRYQISQMTIRNHNIADKKQQRLLLPARLPLVRPVLPHRLRRHVGQNGGYSGLWYFRINMAMNILPIGIGIKKGNQIICQVMEEEIKIGKIPEYLVDCFYNETHYERSREFLRN